MKVADPCGCFPTGRHYPGIAHLIRLQVAGIAAELEGERPWVDLPIAFLDTETTGRDAGADRLIEVGIVIGRGGLIERRHGWLIHPGRPVPPESTAIHKITDADLEGKPPFAEVAAEILEVLAGCIPAAYNASFDRGFLMAELERAGVRPADPPPALRRDVTWLDPLVLARELQKGESSRSLGDVAARLGVSLENAHRATDDAEAALMVLYAFAKDPRVPKSYAALVQEQRRLERGQEDARRLWRRPQG